VLDRAYVQMDSVHKIACHYDGFACARICRVPDTEIGGDGERLVEVEGVLLANIDDD
jgi:hypothetical protein